MGFSQNHAAALMMAQGNIADVPVEEAKKPHAKTIQKSILILR